MATKQGVVPIHGKQYKTVALRVNEFRGRHPDFGLETEIVCNADLVVVKATIKNELERVIATGHAEEVRGSSQINKTSALENCETSAIGRALSAFGLAGEEFASANEVINAIHQQKQGGNFRPGNDPSKLTEDAFEKYTHIKEAYDMGDLDVVCEKFKEFGDPGEKMPVWMCFSSKERSEITKFQKAKNDPQNS